MRNFDHPLAVRSVLRYHEGMESSPITETASVTSVRELVGFLEEDQPVTVMACAPALRGKLGFLQSRGYLVIEHGTVFANWAE